jgi:predicted metal-dependent hydrolase
LPVFQHILLHELIHTVVKNHSVKFWNLLAQYDPNYRVHRRWLKSEAGKAMIFS